MRKVLLAGAAMGAVTLAGAPEAFAQRVEFQQPYAPTSAAPQVRTTPGVTVRLAGRYRFYGQYLDQQGENDRSQFDFFDYARLWLGFDSQAANGLQYGANLEIRMGQGANTAEGDARGNLFYRRMYGYVGTPTMGQVRFGSGQVQAVELMTTGHANAWTASGLWDGDFSAQATGPFPNSFWYSSSGGNNNTAIGYYSPSFYGFDFGVSYSFNNGSFNSGGAVDRLRRAQTAADAARATNIYDIMARYRGTFGGVGVQVSGGYRGSDSVDGNGFAEYNGLSLGILGAQATVAGFRVGGLISFGTAGSPGAALLQKGPNEDDLFMWELGVSYRSGPFGVGFAYHEAEYEGSVAVAADRKDTGFGLGASYAVAPGFNLFAEYLYGTVKESGANVGNGRDSVRTNAILIGTAFNW